MECCRSQWTDKTWKRKQSPIANPELNYLGLSLVPIVIHWLPLHLSWQVKLFNCIFSMYLLLITQKLSSGYTWDLCSRVSHILKVAYSLEDPSMYLVNALIYNFLLLCHYKNVHTATSTLEHVIGSIVNPFFMSGSLVFCSEQTVFIVFEVGAVFCINKFCNVE